MYETLSLKTDQSNMEKKLSWLLSVGALFICTASALATKQFMLRSWPVLFIVGMFLLTVSILGSILIKITRKNKISSDAKYYYRQKNLRRRLRGKRAF